jgi:hypothetical protein
VAFAVPSVQQYLFRDGVATSLFCLWGGLMIYDLISQERPEGLDVQLHTEFGSFRGLLAFSDGPEGGMALAGLSAQLLKTEVRLIPLSLAPLWSRRNAADARRRWPGRELLSRFLTHLEIIVGGMGEAKP